MLVEMIRPQAVQLSGTFQQFNHSTCLQHFICYLTKALIVITQLLTQEYKKQCKDSLVCLAALKPNSGTSLGLYCHILG